MPRNIVSAIGLVCVAVLLLWVVVNLAKDPTRFFNILLIGLTNGAVYGLIALGYTLVYGILQLINFAHGDVFALGGLLASTMILTIFDLSTSDSAAVIVLGVAATLAVAMAFSATLNAGIELVAYRRLRNAPRLAPLITAVGMSFILQNVGLIFWGVNFTSVPRLRAELGRVLDRRRQRPVEQDRRAPDHRCRCCSPSPTSSPRPGRGRRCAPPRRTREAAAMMGVNVNRTISFTFILAGGLAGAAGLLFLLNFTTIRYDQGFQLGLIAFTAAVLGGIGNMTGALVGGLTIGLIEAFNEGLDWQTPGSDWTRSMVFGLLIAILVFRPEGILGERTPEGQ